MMLLNRLLFQTEERSKFENLGKFYRAGISNQDVIWGEKSLPSQTSMHMINHVACLSLSHYYQREQVKNSLSELIRPSKDTLIDMPIKLKGSLQTFLGNGKV